jgi:hypothetical protein
MLFLLLLLFIAGPLVVHEGLRLVDLHTQCTQHWIENALLIQNGICSDPRQRHAHGAKMEQTCREAEQENKVSPEACAFRELWRQGGVYQLWSSVVGNPWMLFGLFGVTLLFAFQAWQYRAQRAMQERLYLETVAAVRPPQALAPAPQALPAPQQQPPIQLIMPSQWLDPRHRYDDDVEHYVYGGGGGGGGAPRLQQRSRVDL